MNTDAIFSHISDYFATQPVTKAWVFGSFSRGEEREDSDVDIIVTLDKEAHVGLIKFSGMRCDLEEILQRNVDLVVDGALMPFAVDSANRDKILVYERTNNKYFCRCKSTFHATTDLLLWQDQLKKPQSSMVRRLACSS